MRTVLSIAAGCALAGVVSIAQTPGVTLTPPYSSSSISRGAVGTGDVPPSPSSTASDTNEIPNVWEKFPGAVQGPGAVRVVTNAGGEAVHQFSLRPTVTDMAAITNGLAQAEQKQEAIEKEMIDLLQRETALKRAMVDDRKELANIATNFVPVDAEGKELKKRLLELDKEIRAVGAELQKRLEADPAFKAAKDKWEADSKALADLQERRKAVRNDRAGLNLEVRQIRQLEGTKPQTGRDSPKPRPRPEGF